MLKKIIMVVVLFCLISGLISYGVLHYHYSDGVRSGRLVKISKKGMLFKTYEGILDLGSGDRLTWDFSVHDSEIGEKLLKLSGKKIQLTYTELLYKVFYNSKYNVTAWKVLETGQSFSNQNFCALIKLMKMDRDIVNLVRKLMVKYKPDLLEKARGCN